MCMHRACAASQGVSNGALLAWRRWELGSVIRHRPPSVQDRGLVADKVVMGKDRRHNTRPCPAGGKCRHPSAARRPSSPRGPALGWNAAGKRSNGPAIRYQALLFVVVLCDRARLCLGCSADARNRAASPRPLKPLVMTLYPPYQLIVAHLQGRWATMPIAKKPGPPCQSTGSRGIGGIQCVLSRCIRE